ncbi:MAG: hypothetical protein ACFFAN_16330, partial [Promethearchaeota archaeon]
MFNAEDFQDYPHLKNLVEKLNNFIYKGKVDKVPKLINELESLLENPELVVPITYFLSIIAEKNIELITERLILKIEPFFRSNNVKLKINSITIIGFFILVNSNYFEKYLFDFIKLLMDKSEDVRDNTHYFLQEFAGKIPNLLNSNYINFFLEALSIENKHENIKSLLNLLDCYNSKNIDFKEYYKLREILKSLITIHFKDKSSEIFFKLTDLIKKFFPSLKKLDFQYLKIDELIKLLDDQFLMKKYNFTENNQLKNYILKIKKSRLKDKEIYFYIKEKKKRICFFELEKKKLIKFFDKKRKISKQKILERFSQILKNESDLKKFIKILIKMGYINGYFSELGYFYPNNYLKSEMFNDFQKKGLINIKKKYDFLPSKFVNSIILELKEDFLLSKTGKIYYSLKKIQEHINTAAAKNSSIDLKAYKKRLKEEHFVKLIKNLPREYLSNLHKGTVWLTNIGKIRIETEIENSKILGYLDISKISEKLNVNKILLMNIITLDVDPRSGIWDKNNEIFYYSKYVKERIDEINLISEDEEKIKEIEKITKELNIDKNHILTKIDENYKLIGEEIKSQDQIKISEYIEKTGMNYKIFIDFINSLEISYFRKGDLLILNPQKIEEVKNSIKLNLIENSKYVNYISLGNFDITTTLIKNLIEDLQNDEKLKGIFFKEEDEIKFYTERGIRKLMLENKFLISFDDLFYGKNLSQKEIYILTEILKDLIKEKKLKGNFDEETLTFSSKELLFEFSYNSAVDDFETMVNKYIKKFDMEFQKIKKILIKRKETVYPREIKVIQDSIDRINNKYVYWRNNLERFIIRVNKKLLNEQGFSIKGYKKLSKEKKDEIKYFE